MVASALFFPGQGSQHVGMGRDLAERFSEARETFECIDDALDAHLSRLMWEGPEEDLTLTHNAQPAILAHSTAVWTTVSRHADLAPAAAAGHSLGEYSAYVAAGALDPAPAARLVRERGTLMYETGTERPGAMSAVLGLDADVVEQACRDASEGNAVAVAANFNAPDQTVISGDPAAVGRAGDACKDAGAKRVLTLKVSGAFHSPLMEPAVEPFRNALETATFDEPAFAVFANATAEPVTESGRAVQLLAEQLTAPVRWIECTRNALGKAGEGARALELGPGKVLTGLVRRIAPGTETVSLGTAEQVTAFLEAQ